MKNDTKPKSDDAVEVWIGTDHCFGGTMKLYETRPTWVPISDDGAGYWRTDRPAKYLDVSHLGVPVPSGECKRFRLVEVSDGA